MQRIDPAQEANAFIDALDQSAERHQTACGPDARMVWHRWGQGKPLLLLHGGAGSWMHWVRNIGPLARTRSVWVPDMPGFGDSDLPAENLDADSIAPHVLAGAQELLRGEHFDLVGFSFGSLVASYVAAARPDTLDRLVLVSASGLGLFQGSPELRSLRGANDPQARAEVLRFNLQAMMLHDPASIDALAVAVQDRSAQRDRVKNRKIARMEVVPGLSAQWRCAAYGVWGRQDFAYRSQFDRLVAKAATLGLRDTAFLDDAGHWLQYECSDAFHRVLAGFLDTPLHATQEDSP